MHTCAAKFSVSDWFIVLFYVTNTFLGHIICMMDRPDVVEREMFSAEFSTGTILWNEMQTLAFFYSTEILS